MISVTTFWWTDKTVAHKARYTYGIEDVLAVKRGFDRFLSLPHEFVCVTDKPERFAGVEGIRAVPLDRTTWVDGTRYAKLMIFRPDIASVIGERIFYTDLDVVPVRSLDPVVGRDEDLVLFRNPNRTFSGRRSFYNTSVMLIRAGTRTEFWSKFDPKTTPTQMKKITSGTDQAWVSHLASQEEAYWDHSHGIIGAGRLGDKFPNTATVLPDDARLVLFPGNRHLSQKAVRDKHPWLNDYLEN